MCGIAGILYKANGVEHDLGGDLITMLDGCQHRGPDSTGFALYHEPSADGNLRLRFLVGEGAAAVAAIGRIRAKLAELDAAILDEETIGTTHRLNVRFDGDLQSFAYAMEHVAKVVSIGESLDIIKDVGSAHDVDDTYAIEGFDGTHGIGHVRLATESDVTPDASATPSGRPASPTSRSSTTGRSRTTGRCDAGSRSAASSSAPTTTPS